ncbi:MAG: ABC transporter substrate-binding protein, partial [Calditrichia bacterium]
LSELWRLCGGSNIFSDIPRRYFSVSKEDLIKRDPGYILEFRVIDPEKAAFEIPRLRSDWQELPTLTAVKQQRIVIFPERYFLIPGPRITKIAMAFSAILAGGKK